MKIQYIKEYLEFIDEFLEIEIDESESDSLILYNKDEFYEIEEILSENMPESYDIKEYYDYIVLKFNLIENKPDITEFYELNLYKYELKTYQKLLKNNKYYEIIENTIGMNQLNDYIHKFHLNHKNFYSFNLDESDESISELLLEIISIVNKPELYSNYEIYSNLDELYESYDLFHLRNFRVNITDESNIIINRESGIITNIDESDLYKIFDISLTELFEDNTKIDELIDIFNLFDELNSYEILNNTECNLNYIHNKLLISFMSFKKYSNNDEYLLLNYTESDENISLNSDEIDKTDLIECILYGVTYYEIDSYEIKEMMKYLNLL